MTRVLHVVTNVATYDDPHHPTGLWLSELTHAWEVFEEAGYEQGLVSPSGGPVPLEPRSLKPPTFDSSARAWVADPAKMALLQSTSAPGEIDVSDYDAVYFTGGHAVMYDVPGSEGLQRITREMFEGGKVVSSVCHGYCGFLQTRLSDGSHLLDGRRLTGFSWREEVVAGVSKDVPYNAEKRASEVGGRYEANPIPFVPNVVVDGRLITGQNPTSAKKTAEAVVAALS